MRAFNLIVSCAENRVIGRAGKLPWKLPEDQRYLREKTAGGVVILGRISFDAWPGAETSGRRAIVVTSGAHASRPGALTAPSLETALAAAEGLPGDIYICGGERIYREAIELPQAQRLYLTLVHAEVEGDRFFPHWGQVFSREVARRDASDDGWSYTFLTLERS